MFSIVVAIDIVIKLLISCIAVIIYNKYCMYLRSAKQHWHFSYCYIRANLASQELSLDHFQTVMIKQLIQLLGCLV